MQYLFKECFPLRVDWAMKMPFNCSLNTAKGFVEAKFWCFFWAKKIMC